MTNGYTAGVFDLFHGGDLDLLRKARAQCARLTVGVLTDELAQTILGTRPFMPLNERLEILRNVRFVDKVISVTDPDLARLRAEFAFDVIFPGISRNGAPTEAEAARQLAGLDVRIAALPDLKDTRSVMVRSALDRARVA